MTPGTHRFLTSAPLSLRLCQIHENNIFCSVVPCVEIVTVTACVGESITLHCNAPRRLHIVDAHYGRFSAKCDVGCCKPDQNDCSQSLRQNHTGEWHNLKVRIIIWQCVEFYGKRWKYPTLLIMCSNFSQMFEQYHVFRNTAPAPPQLGKMSIS